MGCSFFVGEDERSVLRVIGPQDSDRFGFVKTSLLNV